jgi:hypothetical protein
VQLYYGNNLAWTGTGKNGTFTISHLKPGKYMLSVVGWGNTPVELDPSLDKLSNGQGQSYSLQLFDDACVGVTTVVN